MSAPAFSLPHALVRQWWEDAYREHGPSLLEDFAQRAVHWGARRQLELCQHWIDQHADPLLAQRLAVATRPHDRAPAPQRQGRDAHDPT